MKKQFIKDLKVKDSVESTFLVKYIALMEARDGRSYLNLILTDATGDLESRMWGGAKEISETISRGAFVFAKGKINLFQGRTQAIIDEIRVIAEAEIDPNDYIVKSDRPADPMYKELLAIVEQLDDYYIKELLRSILLDSEIERRLKIWQAGKSIHHAYQSGLLEHILSCTKLAVALSAHYRVNKNYVVAGAIMHDLCKIYELTDGPLVDYTEEGKLVGHLVKSLEVLEKFSHRISNFPHSMKIHLKHILLSHHGEYEYGSPKIPQTAEAYLLHLIDLMDSKMGSLEMIKRNDSMKGHWSTHIKHLDRSIFKDELPFFHGPVSDEESSKQSKPVKKSGEKVLTHNMSKLLEGFHPKDE